MSSLKKEAFSYFDQNPTANAAAAARDIGISKSAFYNYRRQWKSRIDTAKQVVESQNRRQHSLTELIESAKGFVASCGDPDTAQEALEAYIAAIE